MGRAFRTHGEKWNLYRILVGRPEGRIPLAWPTHRWEDNINMDCREIEWGGLGSSNSG
jgi:hypothetical protein